MYSRTVVVIRIPRNETRWAQRAEPNRLASTVEDEMMPDQYVPDDFPRELDPGAVPGVQPKLLVRKVNGRYQSGLTEEELWVRYDTCEDLAAQLSAYVSRKIATSGLTEYVALSRAEKGMRLKVDAGEWDFSQREVAWVMKRTWQLLRGATDG